MAEDMNPNAEQAYKEYKDAFYTDHYGQSEGLADEKLEAAKEFKDGNLEALQDEAVRDYEVETEYRRQAEAEIAEMVVAGKYDEAQRAISALDRHVHRGDYMRPARPEPKQTKVGYSSKSSK